MVTVYPIVHFGVNAKLMEYSLKSYSQLADESLRLSPDMEIELIEIVQEGGEGAIHARDCLLLSHIKFIRSLCWKYCRNGKYHADDLMADAIEGFYKAIDAYEIKPNGARLATYAYQKIRYAIETSDLLSGLIKIPRSQRQAIGYIETATLTLTENNEVVTVDTLKETIPVKISRAKILECLYIMRNLIGIESLHKRTERGQVLLNLIPAENAAT
jgi:DNA-directed RNA polymerase specialized sigma subunit